MEERDETYRALLNRALKQLKNVEAQSNIGLDPKQTLQEKIDNRDNQKVAEIKYIGGGAD